MQTFYQDKLNFILFLTYTGICFFAYVLSIRAIEVVKELSLKADIYGKDINKRGTPAGEVKIPEALGIAPASIYLILNSFLILYTQIHSEKLVLQHISGLLSICFIMFLGFCDDVFDLRWRYKLLYPIAASVPLLVAFQGVTYIVVPNIGILRNSLGPTLEFGYIYYIYMIALVIFCTNSINIYAGINGLEVG